MWGSPLADILQLINPTGGSKDGILIEMSKKYSEMTPAERLADRIAKNREIERRVQENQSAVRAAAAPAAGSSRKRSTSTGGTGDTLSEFQRIKRESGIDAASEFVRNKSK